MTFLHKRNGCILLIAVLVVKLLLDKEDESDIENDVENIVNSLAETRTKSYFDEASLLFFHVPFT